jgi:hypothetical protein
LSYFSVSSHFYKISSPPLQHLSYIVFFSCSFHFLLVLFFFTHFLFPL